MTATTPIPPGGRSLVGRHVRLDPSVDDDAEPLFTALDYDEVWASGYSGGPSGRCRSPRGWSARIREAAEESRAMFTSESLVHGAGRGAWIRSASTPSFH